jgi:hypothetical protein
MKNLTIRHNITENDCSKLNYGAIHVWNSEDPGWISDVHIYHNTIYLAPPAGKTLAGLPGPSQAVLKALGIRADSPNQRCPITVSSPTKAVSIHNNLVVYRDRGLFGSPSRRRAVFFWGSFCGERDRGLSSQEPVGTPFHLQMAQSWLMLMHEQTSFSSYPRQPSAPETESIYSLGGCRHVFRCQPCRIPLDS